MREMKNSGVEWIGAIPTTWHTQKMKYISNFIQNKYSSDYGLLPYIGLENIASWSGSFISTNSQYDREQSLICEPEDILFGKLRPYLAKVYMNDRLCCCSNEFAVIRVNGQNKRYMWYQLLSHGFIFEIDRSTYGTKMPRANAEFIRNVFVALPSEIEQQKIANYLDKMCAEIDAVLEKTRASIEEYKKLKQAVITQAVTKGIRGDRPMKDSGIEWIGEIPVEWDVLNLVAHTSMLTPMRDRPENLDGPIPWIRIEDFEGKYIESSKAGLGVSMKTVKEMNLKVYPVGTILCTSSCIMGKCAIVSRELVSNQRFIGIIPDRNTDKTYLYYLMTSNAERMNFLSTGALQANLSRSAFEHLKVQFPPYSEQQEIAAYLDDKCEKIDELILKKQQYLTEIENYKKSLIYEYVTGKREV